MKNLICIHGNSLSCEIFKPLANTNLKERVNFHLIDLEKLCNNNFSIHNLIGALANKLNKIENPKYILAHSLGGHLILQCLQKLKNIYHIVLVGTPPLRSLADYPDAISKVPGQLIQKESWSNYEVDIIVKATSTLNQTEIKTILLNTPTDFRKQLFESLNTYNYINEIETIRKSNIPVSLFFSEKDSFINIEYVEDLKKYFENIKNVQILVKAYDGHIPFYSNTNWFSSVLSDLLFHK